ncbi:hypothetical protein DSO57_1012467 [Entomophthora muscae]|uniref:Uncharacterized protein n=1 Tax=Entomophthora muscae TaxID=34485 RepID=A0ACC2RX50_9FUNG|nr:hypothetical protein DSO57_1012467 [Entomophthora muscae]
MCGGVPPGREAQEDLPNGGGGRPTQETPFLRSGGFLLFFFPVCAAGALFPASCPPSCSSAFL